MKIKEINNRTDNWIEQENARANELSKTGETMNNNAPRLLKATKKPTPVRHIRSIYIQDAHGKAFDKLAFAQKMVKGKKAPELMEEAIELLLKKYNNNM